MNWLLSTDLFVKRGMCGGWDRSLFYAANMADIVIGIAYFTIPALLIWFFRQRLGQLLPFRNLLLIFGAFILLCGSTHFMDAASAIWPAYRFDVLLRIATAIISVAAVGALFPLIAVFKAMESPDGQPG